MLPVKLRGAVAVKTLNLEYRTGFIEARPVFHRAIFVGDFQPFYAVITVFDHDPVASFHIGKGTLFSIGFPDNGGFHESICEEHLVPLLPVLIPMGPNPDHLAFPVLTFSPQLPVFIPHGQRPIMFAEFVIYFRQLLPAFVPMSLQPVPFAVFVAYFRHFPSIMIMRNRLAGKGHVLGWKVIKLVAVLTTFLERFDSNLLFFRAQKRERDRKEDSD